MNHLPQRDRLKKQTEEAEEIVMSNITNPNSIYIYGKLKFAGYKQIKLHLYVDTGASLRIASKVCS